MQYSWFALKSRNITLMINVDIVKAMASPVAQLVTNLPAIQETPVWFLVGRFPGGGISYPLQYSWTSLVAQLVKNVPVMQETWVWSLGQKDPLEKGRAIHSSILAWRIPWTREPGGLQSMGLQTIWHNWAINTFHFHVWNKGEQTILSIIVVLVNSLECACLVRRWGKSPGMGEGQLFC